MLSIADLKVDLTFFVLVLHFLGFLHRRFARRSRDKLFIYFLKFLFGDCALRLGFEMEAKNKVKIDDSTAESPTSVLEDEVCSSVPLFLPRTMISVFEE